MISDFSFFYTNIVVRTKTPTRTQCNGWASGLRIEGLRFEAGIGQDRIFLQTASIFTLPTHCTASPPPPHPPPRSNWSSARLRPSPPSRALQLRRSSSAAPRWMPASKDRPPPRRHRQNERPTAAPEATVARRTAEATVRGPQKGWAEVVQVPAQEEHEQLKGEGRETGVRGGRGRWTLSRAHQCPWHTHFNQKRQINKLPSAVGYATSIRCFVGWSTSHDVYFRAWAVERCRKMTSLSGRQKKVERQRSWKQAMMRGSRRFNSWRMQESTAFLSESKKRERKEKRKWERRRLEGRSNWHVLISHVHVFIESADKYEKLRGTERRKG